MLAKHRNLPKQWNILHSETSVSELLLYHRLGLESCRYRNWQPALVLKSCLWKRCILVAYACGKPKLFTPLDG